MAIVQNCFYILETRVIGFRNVKARENTSFSDIDFLELSSNVKLQRFDKVFKGSNENLKWAVDELYVISHIEKVNRISSPQHEVVNLLCASTP